MARLAIQGHPTRGKEVIEILEMLGCENPYAISTAVEGGLYTISIYDNRIVFCSPTDKFVIFTLEEFLEKYPYMVGDKVQHKWATSCGTVYEIEQIKWEDNQVKYIICDLYWKNCKCTVTSEDLQPYKEETMEENIESFEILESHFANEVKIEFDPSKYEMVKRDNGYYVVKKQPQYPKTYEECCALQNKDAFHPATKEQRDLLFQKMKEAGYEWDAEKKELKKIEDEPENYKQQLMSGITDLVEDYIRQKPVKWDGEDEHRVKDIIYFLDTAKKHYASTVELDACIDWLKSLKERIGE